MVDKESLLLTKGTTGYKVIWVCDESNCRTPDKIHSISACHLIKEKMCFNTQICRPCQCSGEGNGRFGDRRKWSDFLSENDLSLMKDKYSNKWKGELNPSKKDNVKIKKKQTIINYELINKICKDRGFILKDVDKLDGKRSEFKVECDKGHISNKKYINFIKKSKIYNCSKCFYDSISLYLSDDEILMYENYVRQVRALTAKEYRKFKNIINPNNFKIGKKDYHIDHKYSVSEGYKNNVDIRIISSKENLEILYYSINLSKQQRCSITLDELFDKTEYLFKKQ